MTTTKGIILEANVKIDTDNAVFLELKIEGVDGWTSHHYFYSVDKIKKLFVLMRGEYKGDFGTDKLVHAHVNMLNNEGALIPHAISPWPFLDWIYNDNPLKPK